MNRPRRVVPTLAVVVIAAIAAVFVATSGGTMKTAASSSSVVSVERTSLGSVLADGKGRTLYLFEGDRANVSTLSAAGQAIWPPFTSKAKLAAMGGANAALLGTIPGSGGAAQVTYNGHPLYYYVGDQQSGRTTGQGLNQFGARWYVLSSAGRAITSPGTSTSGSTGSAYGY
jgi:predicted lipoprotein with Yx(FWY)xxD motif